MRKASLLLEVLLGAIMVAAGVFGLLRKPEVLYGGLDFFGAVFIIVPGLWIFACNVECRRGYNEDRKS